MKKLKALIFVFSLVFMAVQVNAQSSVRTDREFKITLNSADQSVQLEQMEYSSVMEKVSDLEYIMLVPASNNLDEAMGEADEKIPGAKLEAIPKKKQDATEEK